MFSIELKVNGVLVATAQGRNAFPFKANRHRYVWTYAEHRDVDRPRTIVIEGDMLHRPEDGIAVLAGKILTKAGKDAR